MSARRRVGALPVQRIAMPHDKAGYARTLYDALHTADAAGVDAIWLERPPLDEDWRDVHDRLSRAAQSGG